MLVLLKNVVGRVHKYAKNNLFFRASYHCLRWVSSIEYREEWDLFYATNMKFHEKISRFIAIYLGWIYYPLYIYFLNKNIIFSINNISHAVGHIYPEIDYLIRLNYLMTAENRPRIYYIYPKSPVYGGFYNLFNDICLEFKIHLVLSGFIHVFISPMLLRYSDLTISASISSMNFGLNADKKFKKDISFGAVLSERLKRYAQIRSLTRDFYPLKKVFELPDGLRDYIGQDSYAVIQIKDMAINATFKPVDPYSYLRTIRQLQSMGLKVVFAGRERMPREFKKNGVINYSESNYASVENDYKIVLNSVAVVASASGFCYIADVLGVPLLSINNWHVVAYPGAHTIFMPSILVYRQQELSVLEQFQYVDLLGQDIHSSPGFSVIDADDEDVLLAFEELFTCIESNCWEDTDIQNQFRSQFIDGVIPEQMSRLSTDFLKKYERVLLCRK